MAPIPDRRSLLIASLVCVTGCSSTVPGQKKDGPAALIALRYCEHLLAGEWSAAQALTHPRSAMSPQTLEQKAKALVKRWNLENAGAHISSVGDRPMRDFIGHNGPSAREHDEERAQKLRQPWSPRQRSGGAVFLAHAPPFRSRDFSDRDPNDRDSIDRHCDPTQHWSASSRKARRRSSRA